MDPTTTIRWLHLTDIHCGMTPSQDWLWPNVKQQVHDDLGRLIEKCGGPWDLLLFTGDLAQNGTAEEFAKFDEILRELYERLNALGANPAFLAVPGNHDLIRPKAKGAARYALLALADYATNAETRATFLEDAEDPARELVAEAFAAYTQWWSSVRVGAPIDKRPGLLPGDFAATFDKNDTKLGIVGLNSAFLHLGNGARGKLAIEAKQLHEACGGDVPKWCDSHAASLLLTHHPSSWLSGPMLEHFRREVYPPGRFAAHLFGHMHENHALLINEGGAARTFLQGASLFGLDHFGSESTDKRRHGYTAGALEFDGQGTVSLRTWPRAQISKQGGGARIERDASQVLDDGDDGTQPMLVRTGSASRGPAPLDLASYLEHIEAAYATLDVAGVRGAHVDKITLEQVYVDLRLIGGRRDGEHGLERGGGGTDLAELLDDEAVAITGDPGAGKTMLLRYLALRLARFARGTDAECAREFGFGAAVPAPVFLRLAVVADFLREAKALEKPELPREVWPSVIAHVIAQATGVKPPLDVVEARLAQGGLLLLFDGLDEVSNARERDKLAAAIAALPRGCGNRVVVTCRTRAWGEGQRFREFTEAGIAPFDGDAIDRFVERWCRAVAPEDANEVAAGLRDALRSSTPIRQISSNPQMLTMLAVLYFTDRKLPAQPVELYRRCVELSVERRGDLLDQRWGGAKKAQRYLQELAVAMHGVTATGSATESPEVIRDAIEQGEAVDVLLRALAAEASDVPERDRAEELLYDLENHVGLIVSRDHEVLFRHRTFQEFLVALRIADAADPAAELEPHLRDPGWNEVIALVSGLCADRGPKTLERFLRQLLGELPNGELPDGDDLERVATRAGVAATCLVDLEAWGVPAAVQCVHDRLYQLLPIVENPEQTADETTRARVADGLGRGLDPRLRDDVRWIEVPGGKFWMGAADGDEEVWDWEKPGRSVEVGRFRIHRWPVTIREYRQFIADSDAYEDRECVLWDDDARAWLQEEDVHGPKDWKEQLAKPGNHPVTGVCQWEARAYCRWFNALVGQSADGFVVRLPTEAEWEFAARGLEQPVRFFPWGSEWDARCARLWESPVQGTSAVGMFPLGDGPFGAWDQAGNVWEWCCDRWDAYPGGSLDEWCKVLGVDSPAGRFAVRGGGWGSVPRNLRVSFRLGHLPAGRGVDIGFRPVAAPAVP